VTNSDAPPARLSSLRYGSRKVPAFPRHLPRRFGLKMLWAGVRSTCPQGDLSRAGGTTSAAPVRPRPGHCRKPGRSAPKVLLMADPDRAEGAVNSQPRKRPAQRQAGAVQGTPRTCNNPPRRAHAEAPFQVAEAGAPAQRELVNRAPASRFPALEPSSCKARSSSRSSRRAVVGDALAQRRSGARPTSRRRVRARYRGSQGYLLGTARVGVRGRDSRHNCTPVQASLLTPPRASLLTGAPCGTSTTGALPTCSRLHPPTVRLHTLNGNGRRAVDSAATG